MTVVIVDTNVLVVAAERQEDSWSAADVALCSEALLDIAEGRCSVAIDSSGLIIDEYVQQLGYSGMPMLGQLVAKHLHDRMFDATVCERIDIDIDSDGVATLPDDPGLVGFDPSDRKFAAVALAHPHHPPVWNAVDTDWWLYRDALARVGVSIRFLCEETIRALAAQ